jgi:hypothetical protein
LVAGLIRDSVFDVAFATHTAPNAPTSAHGLNPTLIRAAT